jgi:lysophospholipase L1-like esterase
MKKFQFGVLFLLLLIVSNQLAKGFEYKPITPNTIYLFSPFWCKNVPPISYYDANNNFLYKDSSAYNLSPALAAIARTDSLCSLDTCFDWSNNAPTCNYDQYMRPFWSADTIYNETVLLLNPKNTKPDTTATGKLLYLPKKIISIKSFDGKTTFKEGVDYTYNGKIITKLKGSAMISLPINKVDDSIQSNQYYRQDHYTGLVYKQGKWVTVTYVPDRSDWKMTNFGYKGNLLPKTMAKLRAKQPVTIVAHGMSITRGYNVSGYAYDYVICPATAPYMHSYIDLMDYQLKKIFGYSGINTINASLGGANSDWLVKTARTHVAANKPDLVIIDMGMNDVWSCKANYTAFANNIKAAMDTVRKTNPDVEFILLGGMMIDRNYCMNWDGVTVKTIIRDLNAYQVELKKMETMGVANLDMTTMSDTIYARKAQYRNYGAKSVTTNEMHPNDFLARCYAQGLVALFDSTAVTGINTPTATKSYSMEVVPNPVLNGHFIVHLDKNITTENTNINIYELSGKAVASFTQNTESKDYEASDLNLTKGIYIFEANAGNKRSSKKVIID